MGEIALDPAFLQLDTSFVLTSPAVLILLASVPASEQFDLAILSQHICVHKRFMGLVFISYLAISAEWPALCLMGKQEIGL